MKAVGKWLIYESIFSPLQMEEAYDTRPKARLWDGEYSDSDTEEGEPPKEWNQSIDITEPSPSLK